MTTRKLEVRKKLTPAERQRRISAGLRAHYKMKRERSNLDKGVK